ncbi:ArsR/SmtB family transcription factor [Hoeflea prorocentri]|uniref:Metalloregulator ArsR/SmtB family transcription factor n=1 Tax=Hoeflea prorocentri TaxID=1922333 RepID=A0A9X3UHT9_9HYPH|nr:metalloregulator ArsR/SmtB family transcription factor [Hoeflea prorocentri]MCY6381113.1 metalloregulator ArsR/SmtB family transcription factor [Hoeflea prorocentri]MDA5398913.1 metalloregulator ArsR/SmtB family transcription factor [Hoeflea prorocentri]
MNGGIQGAFRALADPTRREILIKLSEREMTIAEVAENFAITRGAVKKHLTILEEGRLISVHTHGRERINRLEADALRPVSDWLSYFDRFWGSRMLDLKSAVEKHERNSDE